MEQQLVLPDTLQAREPDQLLNDCAAARTLIVVAHPDDEVIGAGALLMSLREPCFLHVTDGAPRRMTDAARAGFTTRRQYARARRDELMAALAIAGIAPGCCIELGVADQEAAFSLVHLVQSVAQALRRLRPGIVLTQPYEGGHPDHDATAFAVHMACRQLDRNGLPPPAILEMTSYHVKQGEICTSEFLPRDTCPVITRNLPRDARDLKSRMLACFKTQRDVLRWFPVLRERFRRAPRYDFTEAPHDGRLFYEHFDWGITGQQWRALARAALGSFDSEGLLCHSQF